LGKVLRIEVRVKPRSKREEIREVEKGKLEVRVKEPPEGGKANRRVIELVASYLKIPKSRLRIVRGHTSKEKVLEAEL